MAGSAHKPVGAPGTAIGVAVALDAVPLPLALTARTSKVYSVSLVSPVTVCDVVVASLPVMPPQSGLQVVVPLEVVPTR